MLDRMGKKVTASSVPMITRNGVSLSGTTDDGKSASSINNPFFCGLLIVSPTPEPSIAYKAFIQDAPAGVNASRLGGWCGVPCKTVEEAAPPGRFCSSNCWPWRWGVTESTAGKRFG